MNISQNNGLNKKRCIAFVSDAAFFFFPTAHIVKSAQSLCTLSAPLQDSLLSCSGNVGFIEDRQTGRGVGAAVCLLRAPVLRFGSCGRLLPGPLSRDWPGCSGWRDGGGGGGVLQSV